MQIAVLFARTDSVYKGMPECDVFDIERDARTFTGGKPVVAHPPCRAWGRLRRFAKPRDDERGLAVWAVEQVRQWGGVLEHPCHSTLWEYVGLAAPGKRDRAGGWTLPVYQGHWGHRAPKATWLYVVGVEPRNIPSMPFDLVLPEGRIERMDKVARERTPREFAEFLVQLAKKAGGM